LISLLVYWKNSLVNYAFGNECPSPRDTAKKPTVVTQTTLVRCFFQMMKEWSAARRRVQEIKKIDAKGGEKFNREMTAVTTLTCLPFHSYYRPAFYMQLQ